MSKIKKSELKERLESLGLNEGFISDFMSAISKLKDKAKAAELQKQVIDLEKKQLDAKEKQLQIQKSVDDFIDSQEDLERKERLQRLSKNLKTYYKYKK
tara:strand:+ start:401 stop:697 length:297 start_codon:yes stop_codon:yes gene_type:complete